MKKQRLNTRRREQQRRKTKLPLKTNKKPLPPAAQQRVTPLCPVPRHGSSPDPAQLLQIPAWNPRVPTQLRPQPAFARETQPVWGFSRPAAWDRCPLSPCFRRATRVVTVRMGESGWEEDGGCDSGAGAVKCGALSPETAA